MSKKILIADKSLPFLMSLSLLLKRLGFDVLPAENGFEVLKSAEFSNPDLIILGVNIEKMDGISLLRHIKQDKKTLHIPVIMLSTDSSSETMSECESFGCFAYLLKPVKIHELHETMQNCLFSHKGTARRHLRCSFDKKVTVTLDGIKHELYSENLSAGGICLRRAGSFPLGSEVEVTLPLKEALQISLKGVVVNTRDVLGRLWGLLPVMAIEFSEISTAHYETLKNFIEDFFAQDILNNL